MSKRADLLCQCYILQDSVPKPYHYECVSRLILCLEDGGRVEREANLLLHTWLYHSAEAQ